MKKTMLKLVKTMVLVTLLVMVSALSAMAGKPAQDIPITNHIADDLSYDLQSDLGGPYTNGAGSVSILVANGYNGIVNGDWRLDLQASSIRTVAITFSTANAVQPGDPGYLVPANPPWWGTQNNAVRAENKCTLINRNMLTMIAGDQFTCPMLIRLSPTDGSSNFYRLVMGFSGEPETQQVLVSCNSVSSVDSRCNDWFIDPIPVVNPDGSTSPGQTRARLNYITTHGKGSTTNQGGFYLTFHIHATRP